MFRLILMHRCIISQLRLTSTNVCKETALHHIGYTGIRGSDNPHLFPVHSEWGRCSFVFKASVEWATLPSEIRGIKSTPLFKHTLKSYLMNKLYSMDSH